MKKRDENRDDTDFDQTDAFYYELLYFEDWSINLSHHDVYPKNAEVEVFFKIDTLSFELSCSIQSL